LREANVTNYPVRNEQHEIGDAADRLFKYIVPSGWAINDASSDYGWDHIVTISDAGTKEVKDELYVQVKGSKSTDFSSDRTYISLELKVTTVNFLLTRSMPTMVAFAGVSSSQEEMFWVWIDAAVSELETRSPSWSSQESVTIRIPGGQILPRDCAAIERHVRQESLNRRVASVMFAVIVPPDRRRMLQLPDPLQINAAFVHQNVLPLVDAGALPAVQTADNRRDSLQRISALLGVFQHAKAQELLEELGPLTEASADLQASAANSRGILLLREGKFNEAVPLFRTAAESDPSQAKYSINLLLTEYLVHGANNLPPDWDQRLIATTTAHPDYAQGIRLRLGVIAEREGLQQADEFARASAAFDKHKRTLLVALADAGRQSHDFDAALGYIEEAERLAGDVDPELESLKGFLLFRTALPLDTPETDGNVRFEGLGPSRMDIGRLNRAADAFKKACAALEAQGFPLLLEETFANAATVLVLAQRAQEARAFCEGFLAHHPAATHVKAALSMVLVHIDKPAEAVPHAKAVLAESNTTRNYKNLLLALLAAEEHSEVLELVSERERHGFSTPEEQALSLEFSALCLWHLGEVEKMRKTIDVLRSLGSEAAADAATLELGIAKRERRPVDELVSQARAALSQHPDHPPLLDVFVRILLPVTKDNASELIELINRIAHSRQIVPEETAVLGEALSTLGRHEEAEQTFGAALARFPHEPDFMLARSQELQALGRDEESFQQLMEFLRLGKNSYAVYRNLGFLARTTGRLDEAIKFFESALKRSKKHDETAEFHCLLFELRRRRGDTGRSRLRHVVEYGHLHSGEPDDEARYLMMFMVTHVTEEEREDVEVQQWIAEFQQRQAKFSAKHPRFQSLVTFKAPNPDEHLN
jgi:tetratricopeptide (TPR) repeat protein